MGYWSSNKIGFQAKIIFFALFLILWSEPSRALSGCVRVGTSCTDTSSHTAASSNDGSAPPISINAPAGCWEDTEQWECYTGSSTNTCTPAMVSGCTLVDNTCTIPGPSGGCNHYEQVYVCSSNATTTCDPSPPGGNCAPLMSVCDDSVFGYCINESTAYTCSEPSTLCISDPACTFDHDTCLSSQDGVCSLQRQFYNCSESVPFCSETGVSSSCSGITTYDIASASTPNNDDAFKTLMQGQSLLRNIQETIEGIPPKIFGGTPMDCTKDLRAAQAIVGGVALGGVGAAVAAMNANNCCSLDVVPTPSVVTECTEQHEQLAGLRRANLTHYLRSGCISGISNPFGSGCLLCEREKQWFCTFDSVLSKIIQEQGREQLNQLAVNGFAGANSYTLNYDFYTPNATDQAGAWTAPLDANGNQVVVWQWPGICDSTKRSAYEIATGTSLAIPGSVNCPNVLETPILACSGGASECPTVTTTPLDQPPKDYLGLSINVLDTRSVAISKYVVATAVLPDGLCETDMSSLAYGKCTLAISAYPGLNGGTAMFALPLQWPMFGSSDGWTGEQALNNYRFKMHYYDPAIYDGELKPAELQYSSDSGATYTLVTLPNPLSFETGYMVGGLRIFGSCETDFQCKYTVIVPNTATTKPWYESSSSGCSVSVLSHCDGFTIEEFQLLDISKMDLTEFTNAIQPPTTTTADFAGNLEAQAVTQGAAASPTSAPIETAEFDDSYAGYSIILANKTKCQFISGTLNDCDIVIHGQSNWPTTSSNIILNTNPVSSMTIDWGDGSPVTIISSVVLVGGVPMFEATHTYNANGEFLIQGTLNMPDGSTKKDIIHLISWELDPPIM